MIRPTTQTSDSMGKILRPLVSIQKNPLVGIVSAFVLMHSLLFVYDLFNPKAFLQADRAVDRLQTVRDLINVVTNGGKIGEFLATHGNVGDYAFHALFYAIGGRLLVILIQCALGLIATVAVYRLAWLITQSAKISVLSAVIFSILPHNVVFPHVLSSEGFFIPLLVFGFYQLGEFCFSEQSRGQLSSSGMAFGIAALVRPVSFAWPAVVCRILILCRVKMTKICKFAFSSFIPMILWMSIVWSLTGHFNEGSSDHDLAHNLYFRIVLAWEKLPEQERDSARKRLPQFHKNETTGLEEADLRQYIMFCAEYPSLCLIHLRTDALAFFGKSGIEKVTVEYFNLTGDSRFQFQDRETGWRSLLESHGAVAVFRYFMNLNPLIAISSSAGLVGILGLWTLTFIGAGVMLSRLGSLPPLAQGYVVALLLFPIYIFSISQFIDELQSRHRAPAEFVLCIFSAVGLYRRQLWIKSESFLSAK